MNNQNKQEQMNEIADEAIRATMEGKIHWERSFKKNTFQTVISRKPANFMDLEIHQEQDTDKIKLAIRHNGNLVKSFRPDQQEELQEIMEHLNKNIPKAGEKIQWALEQLKKIRREETEKTTMTSPQWTINRTMNALDESESGDIELEVKIHFKEPQGKEVDWEFWVNALDHFLQYDNLNQFVQDTDYWPNQMDFLRTSSTFLFNLDGVNLEAPNLVLGGEAVRYLAMANDRVKNDNPAVQAFWAFTKKTVEEKVTPLPGEDNIISRVKFEMWFAERDRAQPVLAYITHS